MKRLLLTAAFLVTLCTMGHTDDLYKVKLHSEADARLLRSTGAEPLAWVGGGYLVLAHQDASQTINESTLDAVLLKTGLIREQLALDGRLDRLNAERYPVVYEEEGVRLLLFGDLDLAPEDRPYGIFPISNEHLEIVHYPTGVTAGFEVFVDPQLQNLVDAVSANSLLFWVSSLQAFPGRVAGSEGNRQARDWIEAKFLQFGYDSVVIDTFSTWAETYYNVRAVKPGTVFPEREIVVGAHFDAVTASPGADDNGSGTAGVLEIAQILSEVDMPVTVVFVAFDAEEIGLLGSDHYVDEALDRDAEILLMVNMDMIGDIENIDEARLYHGPSTCYAVLWDSLGQEYAGITGHLFGTSTRSDHYPFQQAGYDVCSVMEYEPSSVYHTVNDNIDHMSFDYVEKMVQASLATVYTVATMPPPIDIISVLQVGDGQSLQITWQESEWPDLDHYQLTYFPTGQPSSITELAVSADYTTFATGGMTEGLEYTMYAQAVDTYGRKSVPLHNPFTTTPESEPVAPVGLVAMPLREAVELKWSGNNDELDFDHYSIVRDGAEVGVTSDTYYVDDDFPALGGDMHSYYVMAVDADDIGSDTLLVDPTLMRAATLEPDRILALNRTSIYVVDYADEVETGVFLRQALSGYNFDYYSDTAATTSSLGIDLVDMLDYGLMVVGAESGLHDDIGNNPLWNGILDTLTYYLSIGGKAIIFGRWGDMGGQDTIDYLTTPHSYDDAYSTYFHINRRVQTPSYLKFDTVAADLVGAHSRRPKYPDLVWDSLLTLSHSRASWYDVNHVTAIPCVSFSDCRYPQTSVLYSYDSRDDDPNREGKPVAWSYPNGDYAYVYFDIPLSFFERNGAIAALRQAVEDLTEIDTSVRDDDEGLLPRTFSLKQNFPNPFNPSTTIEYWLPLAADVKLTVYNLLGQKVRVLVDARQTAGRKTVVWDGTTTSGARVASGLYFYRFEAGSYNRTRKMVVLK